MLGKLAHLSLAMPKPMPKQSHHRSSRSKRSKRTWHIANDAFLSADNEPSRRSNRRGGGGWRGKAKHSGAPRVNLKMDARLAYWSIGRNDASTYSTLNWRQSHKYRVLDQTTTISTHMDREVNLKVNAITGVLIPGFFVYVSCVYIAMISASAYCCKSLRIAGNNDMARWENLYQTKPQPLQQKRVIWRAFGMIILLSHVYGTIIHLHDIWSGFNLYSIVYNADVCRFCVNCVQFAAAPCTMRLRFVCLSNILYPSSGLAHARSLEALFRLLLLRRTGLSLVGKKTTAQTYN